MTDFLLTWLICAIVFLVIDLAWIGGVAKTFYRNKIGHLLAEKFRLLPAALFYVFYVAGVVWFCVWGAESWKAATVSGALFGFFCYATYDMTNYATLRNWPLQMVFVDIIWGTVLSASVAGGGAYLSSILLN
ncbi:MAG: DUF2177 family protein [Pseudomonadota bacterium]|nr:DUF2177 family protein [Pseudomonadota bacterium]